MRGYIGIIVTLLIAAIVGVGAYELGLSQAVATSGAGAQAAPAYYYHPFWGFGFFGLLFPLFFLFLIFGALRAAFGGWGRGYGGWSRHDARQRIEELHRELHAERPQGTSSTPPPTGR